MGVILSSYHRFDLYRKRAWLTKEAAAKQLGVDLSTLDVWYRYGIPAKKRPLLVAWCGVEVAKWILTGTKAPPWYLNMVLADVVAGTLKQEVNWADFLQTHVYHAWLDLLRGNLHAALLRSDCAIPLPTGTRVKRILFLGNPFGALTDQLSKLELEQIAEYLGCCPEKPLADVLRKSHRPLRKSHAKHQEPDPAYWDRLCLKLRQVRKRLGLARHDPQRWNIEAEQMRQLLTQPWERENEPDVSGDALIPVLTAVIQSAWASEMLGPHKQQLEQSIERILVMLFVNRRVKVSEDGSTEPAEYSRSFKASDVHDALYRYAGLIVKTGKADGSIAPDTVLDCMNNISRREGSRLQNDLKKWVMNP